ncbi:response regulator transcription factor [Clostridium sp. D33t1_170424_F3]|uniref:response regulator transcription factor n=1 Tax=Clostridium sp. D33t1_170424_F3 TaxID=2787099 RepID=UPI0018AC5C73|nr:response regulator transcription factor [Clostridium sp. D33t1_170424_F3]
MNKLLLLEDDISLIDGLQYALRKNGYAFETARTVGEAKALLEQQSFDLLLLDVTLPDGTGFSACEWVRGRGNRVPIIFLTASDEEVNVIRGLDSGGDDYITKPFRMGELFSRIRALLRRTGRADAPESGEILCGDLVIDLLKSRAILRGAPLDLTLGEYKLLCLLVRNTGRVVSRQSILDTLWDQNGNFVDDNTLSVYVRRLREKVESDPSHPAHLTTVRGFGYQWNEVSV